MANTKTNLLKQRLAELSGDEHYNSLIEDCKQALASRFPNNSGRRTRCLQLYIAGLWTARGYS